MKEYFQGFLLMVQFLTRIPINISLPCGKENFKKGAAFLPVVGLIIGFIQIFVYYSLIKVFSLNITTIFVILVPIIITGGLHIDGLGDTCDGFFALKGRDKVIEIMKDSRIGTFACIAIVFNILLKFTLTQTILANKIAYMIVLAPVLSRFSIFFLALIGKCAKSSGSGNLFIGNMGKAELVICSILALILSTSFGGITKTLIIIPSVMLLTYLFNKFCVYKMDGITGDSFGANNELVEILVLMILAITI